MFIIKLGFYSNYCSVFIICKLWALKIMIRCVFQSFYFCIKLNNINIFFDSYSTEWSRFCVYHLWITKNLYRACHKNCDILLRMLLCCKDIREMDLCFDKLFLTWNFFQILTLYNQIRMKRHQKSIIILITRVNVASSEPFRILNQLVFVQ